MRFGASELLLIVVIALSMAVVLYPAARILQRLGYPAPLALLSVIPLLNLVLLWYVALAAWPVDERNRRAPR